MADSLTYHAPGIHLGLPESEYHADPSFSNSGLKHLRVSPLTYWAKSPLNPDYESEDTEAKETGKAFHKRILEGAEAFAAAYAPELDAADHPKALKSGEQLRKYCKDLALKQSGSLAEMSARIREVDAVVELWAELEESHLKLHEGKEFLPKKVIRRIELAAAALEADPESAKLFTGGFAEVSIFWEDPATGVRMKCRLDFLTLETITDLKTFSNPQEKPLRDAVAVALVSKYGTQPVVYLRAVEQLKAMLREQGMGAIHLHDSVLDMDITGLEGFFSKLSKSKPHRFVFLFQESGQAPNVELIEFQRNINYFDIMSFHVEWGIKQYGECMERWGPHKPWVSPAAVHKLEDEDLPAWAMK